MNNFTSSNLKKCAICNKESIEAGLNSIVCERCNDKCIVCRNKLNTPKEERIVMKDIYNCSYTICDSCYEKGLRYINEQNPYSRVFKISEYEKHIQEAKLRLAKKYQ
ncbi:hypothetical protein BFS06_13745 [Clostridium perfringens]|uniref:hypothetical protein n=1 Tax=Clostridium perfringens TaxID=1502 RepID=UPI0007763639|nr:hypothetical protein [Clostridium perfringens]TBX14268.1 hypothetical protein BFS06_13745 [Clostridium perfringens]